MSLSFSGCLSCMSGFTLQAGICYRVIQNCFSYNIITRGCRLCQ